MRTLEAAAAAAGKTPERFLADHWRGIGSRIRETMGRKKAARAGRVALSEGRTVARKAAPAPAPVVASAAVAETEMATAFRRGGLDAEGALVAARGRHGLHEAVKDGSGFVATDYAYSGDGEDPGTWRLLLVVKPGDGALGAYDPDLVRAAATAISTPEWGAPQVDIPAADLDRVRQTIRGAWIQAGLPVTEMPPALDEAALRREFVRGGMSESAATTATRGRGRA